MIADFSSVLGVMATCLALFGFLDLVLEERYKQTVAWYLFGFEEIRFSGFERSVILGLLSLFQRAGRLSPLRVLIYSVWALALSLLVAALNGTLKPEAPFHEMFAVMIVLAVSSWPFDYWSIFVTRSLFSGAAGPPWKLPALILADLAFSAVPYAALFAVIGWSGAFTGPSGYEELALPQKLVFVATIGGAVSMLFSLGITFAQIVILCGGLILRAVTGITRLNLVLAAHSRLHDYPFSYIGLLTGAVLAAIA
ncbi:MAG: hypothetical protein AAFR17_08300 [Pseudomonadota bacterium]